MAACLSDWLTEELSDKLGKWMTARPGDRFSDWMTHDLVE